MDCPGSENADGSIEEICSFVLENQEDECLSDCDSDTMEEINEWIMSCNCFSYNTDKAGCEDAGCEWDDDCEGYDNVQCSEHDSCAWDEGSSECVPSSEEIICIYEGDE